MPELNEKKIKIYNFIRERAQIGVPPSVREICAATGIRSTSTVHANLKLLEEYGYINRESGLNRNILLSDTKKTVQVPILGKITAGNPILAIEDIEGSIPYALGDKSPENFFALHVSGNSMINAGILDKDYIIAEKDVLVEEGDIVVALLDDEATVKRFFKEGNKIRLQPENPDFEPIIAEGIEIIGKVCCVIRYY